MRIQWCPRSRFAHSAVMSVVCLLLAAVLTACGGSGLDVSPTSSDTFRIALILPSAKEDLAWSRGMYDGLLAAQEERGEDRLDVVIEEDLPSPGDAAASLRYHAEQGVDLIIAHGPQYGDTLLELAAAFPDVSFAYGSGSDTASNVFAYDPQAQEGGYLLGMLAGLLTHSSKTGLVGLVESHDAARYGQGFAQGVEAVNAGVEVLVDYTGSYGSKAAAVQMANAHMDNGADVLTGTALRGQGAVQAATEREVPWLASDLGASTAWPESVLAAQVYHWKDLVLYLVDTRTGGVKGGEHVLLSFGNGWLSLGYGEGFAVPSDVRAKLDGAVQAITNGSLVVE